MVLTRILVLFKHDHRAPNPSKAKLESRPHYKVKPSKIFRIQKVSLYFLIFFFKIIYNLSKIKIILLKALAIYNLASRQFNSNCTLHVVNKEMWKRLYRWWNTNTITIKGHTHFTKRILHHPLQVKAI